MHVGLRLRRALRDQATVGRVGGDEFAVLVEWEDGQGPGAGSAAIAERILETIAAPYEVDGREFILSVSIGIAHAEPGMSFDELLRDADLAMYDGRERGTGGYSLFGVRGRELLERLCLPEPWQVRHRALPPVRHQRLLSYLRRLPVTHVKIAREFVDQVEASPHDLVGALLEP